MFFSNLFHLLGNVGELVFCYKEKIDLFNLVPCKNAVGYNCYRPIESSSRKSLRMRIRMLL